MTLNRHPIQHLPHHPSLLFGDLFTLIFECHNSGHQRGCFHGYVGCFYNLFHPIAQLVDFMAQSDNQRLQIATSLRQMFLHTLNQMNRFPLYRVDDGF